MSSKIKRLNFIDETNNSTCGRALLLTEGAPAAGRKELLLYCVCIDWGWCCGVKLKDKRRIKKKEEIREGGGKRERQEKVKGEGTRKTKGVKHQAEVAVT